MPSNAGSETERADPKSRCDAHDVSVSRRLQRPPDLAQRFDRIADAYEARPGYPTGVFDILVERCGLRTGARVLEIGPGVGQATLPMLDRGAVVTAVEPGPSLARRLSERTAGRTIEILVSKFEDSSPAGTASNLRPLQRRSAGECQQDETQAVARRAD